MRGHRGIVALLVAFESPRAVPPTRLPIVDSERDEFEWPLANVEKIVVEDAFPPAVRLGITVAGPYMIRPRGCVLYERSAYLRNETRSH